MAVRHRVTPYGPQATTHVRNELSAGTARINYNLLVIKFSKKFLIGVEVGKVLCYNAIEYIMGEI